MRKRFSVLGLGVMLLAIGAGARAEAPAVLAIQGARIVPVSGPVLERGTVVVRDGLIEAVGANVPIPADARVLDGSGLTVYPGLIDALTDLGLPQTAAPAAGRTAGGGAPGLGAPAVVLPTARPAQETPSRDRASVASYIRAADLVVAGGTRIEEARRAGITAALVAPPRGIFSGQSAVISLGDSSRYLVVRTPVAMHVAMSGGGGFREFPGSLMGVMAHISQTLLDARHQQQAWNIYSKNKRGVRRPATDRALEALLPVVDGTMPLILSASQDFEIARAVALAEKHKIKIILSGGQEAGKAASLLKSKNIPVLVSLNFPERERDVAPDFDETLAQLRRRVEAPQNVAAIHKGQVRFAFYSDGLSNPRDFVRNAGRAVQAGVPADAALRALTLSAAEILGVDAQLGSVESGKIANLVVTDGDLFAERTRIKYVVVDGEKYDVPAEEPRPAGGTAAAPAVDLTGRWSGTAETQQGTQPFTIELVQQGETLTGKVSSPTRGTVDIQNGTISGSEVRFKASIQVAERTVEASFVATVSGQELRGTITLGTDAAVPFTARREPR